MCHNSESSTLTLCSPQVKPRTSLVHPVLLTCVFLTGIRLQHCLSISLLIFVFFIAICGTHTVTILYLSSHPEHNNVACPTTASVQELSNSSTQLTPKKKPRKRQKRKGKKKLEKKKEKQRLRHRVPSGVPEQESGGSQVRVLVRIHPIESCK